MINISQLTKKEIGSWVGYYGSSNRIEKGRIKSWNDKFIFVVYYCHDEWDRFQDFTGAATKSEDLIFLGQAKRN